jgi:hypothetical protein
MFPLKTMNNMRAQSRPIVTRPDEMNEIMSWTYISRPRDAQRRVITGAKIERSCNVNTD